MSNFCPQCGTEVVDEANFCMKCGHDFRGVQAAAAAATAAVAPGPAPAPVQTQPDGTARPWIQNSGVVNPNPVAGYETYNPTFHCKCEYCYFEFDYRPGALSAAYACHRAQTEAYPKSLCRHI